jgi:hypothetical protein
MNLEKHLEDFQNNLDLIDRKTEAFQRNPELTSFESDPPEALDGLGVMSAAVRGSFSQMCSDLDAVRQVRLREGKDET